VLQDGQMFDAARRALLQGRAALGRPAALALELAELEQRQGQWEAAAREWALAVGASATQHANAVSQLEQIPEDARPRVLRQLWMPGNARAQRVAAELLLAWGEPLRGWTLLEGTLVPPGPEVPSVVRRFADRAGATNTTAGRQAQGLALERFAELVPAPLAVRARADATRALLAAGDRLGARRVLERMAADSSAPTETQLLAQTAFVQALIDEQQLDSATNRLQALGTRLPVDERQALQFAIARARIRRGELEQASTLLRRDSTVAGLALQGWVALYRGQLKDATALFRKAGPYAGERRDATERTAMLALLQQIRAAESPELGAALLRLARGDSSAAVPSLRKAADRLVGGGRADVLLIAGQVAAALSGRENEAVDIFEEVVRVGGQGAAAPAAELAWARLLLRQGQPQEAVQHLERLILTYPGSAHVPEARRELERARGAIPRS
jgi:tetratricopeptide (TPR) repeat protein